MKKQFKTEQLRALINMEDPLRKAVALLERDARELAEAREKDGGPLSQTEACGVLLIHTQVATELLAQWDQALAEWRLMTQRTEQN